MMSPSHLPAQFRIIVTGLGQQRLALLRVGNVDLSEDLLGSFLHYFMRIGAKRGKSVTRNGALSLNEDLDGAASGFLPLSIEGRRDRIQNDDSRLRPDRFSPRRLR